MYQPSVSTRSLFLSHAFGVVSFASTVVRWRAVTLNICFRSPVSVTVAVYVTTPSPFVADDGPALADGEPGAATKYFLFASLICTTRPMSHCCRTTSSDP